MRKLMITVIIFFAIAINVDQKSIDASNDSKADLMGYEIDLDVYTSYKAYDTISSYADYNNVHIGYVKLYSAAYERLDDPDSWIVINYSKIEPIDGWVSWHDYAAVHTVYVDNYTDVDGQYQAGPYGSFYSSEGYDMMSPTPTAAPEMTEYEVGLDLQSGESPVFSITSGFALGDLDINTYHSFSSQYFRVNYQYGCSGFLNLDCSYRNTSTEQRSSYKIDKSGETYAPNRCQFLQRPYIRARFFIDGTWNVYFRTVNINTTLLY